MRTYASYHGHYPGIVVCMGEIPERELTRLEREGLRVYGNVFRRVAEEEKAIYETVKWGEDVASPFLGHLVAKIDGVYTSAACRSVEELSAELENMIGCKKLWIYSTDRRGNELSDNFRNTLKRHFKRGGALETASTVVVFIADPIEAAVIATKRLSKEVALSGLSAQISVSSERFTKWKESAESIRRSIRLNERDPFSFESRALDKFVGSKSWKVRQSAGLLFGSHLLG